MRRFAQQLLFLAILAAILLGSAGNVLGGFLVEDYKARTVLGVKTSGQYDLRDDYRVGGIPWVAELLPPHPVELPRGGTPLFLEVLKAAYGADKGWTYVTAGQNLSDGSLKVHSYDVHGNTDFVGIEGNARATENIGFDLAYVPGRGTADPTRNVQWIQVVQITTYNAQDQVEKVEKFVDVTPGHMNPYYNSSSPIADSRNFLDAPVELEIGKRHVWQAEVYLVTGGNFPGEVTIYNGVGWGWQNYVVPEPSSLFLLALGAVSAGWYGWRRGHRAMNNGSASCKKP